MIIKYYNLDCESIIELMYDDGIAIIKEYLYHTSQHKFQEREPLEFKSLHDAEKYILEVYDVYDPKEIDYNIFQSKIDTRFL